MGEPAVEPVATPALRVSGLTKHFGTVQALRGVDLQVESARVHGLIGPNGSGKTTLFNVVCGQDRPTAGSVWIAGVESTGLAPEAVARRGVARTFQIPRSFRGLTVRENVLAATHLAGSVGLLRAMVRLPPTRREEAALREKVGEVLAFVGIEALADRIAGTLSSGHTRLLEIARALATDPELVLMDEPAAGLSPYEADQVAGLVGELRTAGRSILLVEHNVNFVMSLCDSISVLYNGELLADGTPAEVRADPRVVSAYLGAGA